MALAFTVSAGVAWGQPPGTPIDQDGDGVRDTEDNCILIANTDQIDDDHPQDGYGNICDGDFDNDGIVGGKDFAIFRECLNSLRDGKPWRLVCDMNGNRYLENNDFRRFRRSFGRGVPGPSGLSVKP